MSKWYLFLLIALVWSGNLSASCNVHESTELTLRKLEDQHTPTKSTPKARPNVKQYIPMFKELGLNVLICTGVYLVSFVSLRKLALLLLPPLRK